MSADILRRAAARARELAESATPGPWQSTWEASDQWYSITGAPHPLGGGLWAHCPEVATVESGGRDEAEHIAAWDPTVALAVAAWLDLVARLLDQGSTPGPLVVEASLATARALLREEATS